MGRRFDGRRPIKVQVEQLATGQDSTFGSPTVGWTTFAANVPASFEDIGGDERYGDQQVEGLARFRVRLNYVKGVTEKMRLNFTKDGVQHLMDIIAVNNLNLQNRELILTCKTGVNRG